MADRFDLTRQNDLAIDQGADYKLELEFLDAADVAIDISAKTYAGQLKKSPEDAAAAAAFGFAFPGGGSDGKVDATLSAAVTAGLDPGTYVYDIEETTGAVITRVMEGVAEVTAQVTQ